MKVSGSHWMNALEPNESCASCRDAPRGNCDVLTKISRTICASGEVGLGAAADRASAPGCSGHRRRSAHGMRLCCDDLERFWSGTGRVGTR